MSLENKFANLLSDKSNEMILFSKENNSFRSHWNSVILPREYRMWKKRKENELLLRRFVFHAGKKPVDRTRPRCNKPDAARESNAEEKIKYLRGLCLSRSHGVQCSPSWPVLSNPFNLCVTANITVRKGRTNMLVPFTFIFDIKAGNSCA